MPGRDLPRVGPGGSHHSRHLQHGHHSHSHRRHRGGPAGSRFPEDHHAAIRQPRFAVRRSDSAVPPLRAGGRDRQGLRPDGSPALRGLPGHRPGRSAGGHRRQLGQVSGRAKCRGIGLQAEPRGGQGDRPSTAPPRHGRRHRHGLRRHAKREASPRGGGLAPGGTEEGPGAPEGAQDQQVWPDRNDAAEDEAQHRAVDLHGM